MKWKAIPVYTKGSVAYLPTTYVTDGGPYVQSEPVEIVARSDVSAMKAAMQRVMDRGLVANSSLGYKSESPLVKLSGSESWKAFAQGTEYWVLSCNDEGLTMFAHGFPNARGAWIKGPREQVSLGPTLDEMQVLEEFIAFINRDVR